MRPRPCDPRLAAGHRDAPIHDEEGVARIPHLCGRRRELWVLAGWRRQEADGAVGGAESEHSGEAGEAGGTRGTVGRGDCMMRWKGKGVCFFEVRKLGAEGDTGGCQPIGLGPGSGQQAGSVYKVHYAHHCSDHLAILLPRCPETNSIFRLEWPSRPLLF